MSVAPVTAPRPRPVVLPVAVAPSEAGVLPRPGRAVSAGDAISALMQMSAQLAEAQAHSAQEETVTNAKVREDATERRHDALVKAMEEAKKAIEDNSGPFDFITDNLGPIGLVGMIVGSAYLVAADVAAHAVGLENGKMDLADAAGLGAMLAGPAGIGLYAAQQCVKKFGPEGLQQALEQGPTLSDDDVAMANKLAFTLSQAQLAIAATVATGGTSAPAVVALVGTAISTTTQVAVETGLLEKVAGDKAGWIALGGMAVGGALQVGGSLEAGVSIASTAQTLVKGYEASHAIRQGIHNADAAGHRREADLQQAVAKGQKYFLEMCEDMLEAIVDDLKASKESAAKSAELCAEMSQTHDQTLLTAASLRG